MELRKSELIAELVELYHKNPKAVSAYDFRVLASLAMHCLCIVIDRQTP
jgi:hypothetical protein